MTITTGAGFDPAGICPAGIGMPVTSYALTSGGFQESTTGAVSSVLVDSDSLDYVLDANGNEEGMSDTAQRVQMCLATLLGSRVGFQSFGFRGPRKVTDTVKTEVTEAVRTAMLPVTSDGSATILSVEVVAEGTRVFALVRWQDNRNNAQPVTSKASF